MGTQCREYNYNNPNVVFSREDGKQQQYLTPFSSITIPGSHGRKYEVSLAPSRNIFEMHLGHHQYYTQDHLNNVPYNQQPHSVAYSPQPVATYAMQQGSAYTQQSGSAYPQQTAYNPISASAPTIIKTPTFANTITPSYNGVTPSQLNLLRRPSPRVLRVCYTSGRCEYVNDNQQLQRILQQSRTKLPFSSGISLPSQSPSGSIKAGNKAQRNRRLFPYSEVPIAQYPFKK